MTPITYPQRTAGVKEAEGAILKTAASFSRRRYGDEQ